MTTVGPFTKMDFLSITDRCTREQRDFVRELLNSKTSSVLIIDVDTKNDGALKTFTIPTDEMVRPTYHALLKGLSERDKDPRQTTDVAREKMRRWFSGSYHPEITDVYGFMTCLSTALKAMKENNSFSDPMIRAMSALAGINMDKKRFTMFIEDGREPNKNSVPGADFGMAWGFFDYFEKLVQYTPKAIYVKITIDKHSDLVVNKLGFYSNVDPDKTKAAVDAELSRIFGTV